MILQIACLYDKKALAYKMPFFVVRMELATRALSGAVMEKNPTDISMHPEDFALYHLGSFNDESGLIVQHVNPIHVCEAVAFKKVSVLSKGNLDV